MELTLVGTGHVFAIGEHVQRIIHERQPDLVCVELDPVRLRGLEERRQIARMEADNDPRLPEIRRKQEEATKRMPFLYRFLARLQERLATEQGVEAGGEMLAAVDAARSDQIPVACIDVDAQALIRRAWTQMRFGERIRFLFAIWRGQKQSTVDSEMETYQQDPVAYLAQVGDQFPTLKRVLIDDRDRHMAQAILAIEQQKHRLPGNPETVRVVAVVGDGHIAGMLDHLTDKLDPARIETLRVQDLRSGQIAPSPFPRRHIDTNSAGVSFDVTGGNVAEP